MIPAEPVLPPMKVLQIILNTHAGDTCQALATAFKSHSAECQLSLPVLYKHGQGGRILQQATRADLER